MKENNNLSIKYFSNFLKNISKVIMIQNIQITIFILFYMIQYVNNLDIYTTTLFNEYHRFELIPYKENNTDYYMFISAKQFYILLIKFNSYGDKIDEKKINYNDYIQGYIDVKSVNGENSFLISSEKHYFLNRTDIYFLNKDIINNNIYITPFGTGNTYFSDSSFVFLDLERYDYYYHFPIINFYDNKLQFKTKKHFIQTYDKSKSCGESAKIIATSKLYHMLLFYTENNSKNTIIKTISYNNGSNQLEELKIMNISEFKGILNYEVDYIDINNKDLILFCLNNVSVYCLYGNYNMNTNQLIYDKNIQYKLPYECGYYIFVVKMRVIKNNESFYYICYHYNINDNSDKYISLSIIKYEKGKKLYSEKDTDNIKIPFICYQIMHPNFVIFEKKGPAIFYYFESADESSKSIQISYFNPSIYCKDFSIEYMENTNNSFSFYNLFDIIGENDASFNKQFKIIEISDGINLFYEGNNVLVNENYNYNISINILTEKKGIYYIKYHAINNKETICEITINVVFNPSSIENEEEEEITLPNINSISLNNENESIKIIIIFEKILHNINFNQINLFNINHNLTSISIIKEEEKEKEIIVEFDYPEKGFYNLEIHYNNNSVYIDNNLIEIKEKCKNGYTKLNDNCISSKELVDWDLTQFCKYYCQNLNYKYCIKGFAKIKDNSKCICKKGFKGDKCEIEINDNEINVKIIEKKKIINIGTIRNNKFHLNKQNITFYINIYYDNLLIESYSWDIKIENNEKKDDKLMITYSSLQMNQYLF